MSASQTLSVPVTPGTMSSSTSSASATTTSTISTGSNFPMQQNELYLWTFLATLLLLMGVSGFIIIRSYLCRRRLRLRLEEAIRNGQVLAPIQGMRQKSFGPKPKMWEIWISRSENEWANVIPLSAEVVPLQQYPLRPLYHRQPKRSSSSLLQSVIRFPMPKPRPTQSSSSILPETAAKEVPPPPSPSETDNQSIRVTTLIEMPSCSRRAPSRRSTSSSSTLKGKQRESAARDEINAGCERLPPVVFGVADFQLNWGTAKESPEEVHAEEKGETERTTESSSL